MFTVFPSEHECFPVFSIVEGETMAIVGVEAEYPFDIFPVPIQIKPVTVLSVIKPGPCAPLDVAVF